MDACEKTPSMLVVAKETIGKELDMQVEHLPQVAAQIAQREIAVGGSSLPVLLRVALKVKSNSCSQMEIAQLEGAVSKMNTYDDEPDVGLHTLAALIAELMPGQAILLDSRAPDARAGKKWRMSVANVGDGWLVDLPSVGQPEKISFPGQLLLRDAGFSSPTNETSTGAEGSYLLRFDFDDGPAVARILLEVHEHVFGLPHPWLFTEIRAKSFLTGVQPPCLHALTHLFGAA